MLYENALYLYWVSDIDASCYGLPGTAACLRDARRPLSRCRNSVRSANGDAFAYARTASAGAKRYAFAAADRYPHSQAHESAHAQAGRAYHENGAGCICPG
jgi:hypothetical protein